MFSKGDSENKKEKDTRRKMLLHIIKQIGISYERDENFRMGNSGDQKP